jgi:hypothetical protein
MRPLPANRILELWEAGESLNRADRALLLLSAADSDDCVETLADLPLGERDARLLLARECTLGRTLAVFSKCPVCGEKYEFALDTRELLLRHRPNEGKGGELVVDDLVLRFRLPSSRDIAAILRSPSAEATRLALADRCVTGAHRDGLSVRVRDLPANALNRLAEVMSELDPMAEVPVALACERCGHEWQPLFDIAEFFWTELRALAHRLLREVHTLARFYGWHEPDILAMSARRRRAYLELVGT